ncbi:hypothetical protein BHU72_01845 [Desulfuribacillus stibiiarsenatis]|uniref:Uncharacterized protein n=1 Tax=Desulfuribacillus stibiiarsenatis TaxID=1390249 RepID=A0A1E5LA68_9FIRM|nr:hypothetical protein [Desulfuribacillus stibiiarsenatis]OEH87021.1 hypothetical protein BHU72_01845 [Desulfuribacillus stibiiarsenatis]
MYYHGIKAEYLHVHYPIINPIRTEQRKSPTQLRDGLNLKRRFGFEPVHLLECSEDYPRGHCLRSCSTFGDTIFVFDTIELPILILSSHERGVSHLDLRKARYCYITSVDAARHVRAWLPNLPIKIDLLLERNTIEKT